MGCPAEEVCKNILEAERSITLIHERLAKEDDLLNDMQIFMKDFSVFMKEWPEVKAKVSKTAEIIEAWENLKGFHNTLTFVSKFLKVLAVIGASSAAIYAMLKGLK